MTAATSTVPEACLDPWLLIELADGETILFGFATSHPVTGGQSWMRSSPVRDFDMTAGRVRTQGGRHYVLGRRAGVDQLEEEGRAALALLVLILEGMLADGVAPAGTREWLIARKWARHLNVDPPPRDDPGAVLKFLNTYADLYASLRNASREADGGR